MPDYIHLIRAHADRLNALHEAVHHTYAQRSRSVAARREWEQACQAFHAHRSAVSDLLERAGREDLGEDAELRAFAFAYLAEDPLHFRSGFAKERLLQRIKRLDLTEDETAVLRRVLLQRVHGPGRREFRRYCRLLPRVADESLVATLVALSKSADPSIRARARFALSYVPTRPQDRR